MTSPRARTRARGGGLFKTLIRGVHHSAPPAYAEFLTGEPLRSEQAPVLARAMQECSIVHIADLTQFEAYHKGAPLAVASFQLGGVRSILMVPLVKDEVSLGMFGWRHAQASRDPGAHSLRVATRNDVRPDAQSRPVSDAH